MPNVYDENYLYGPHPAVYGPTYHGPAGAPRTLHLPGQTWRQLIEGDSRYLAKKNALAAAGAAAAASRQAAVRAALIKLGMAPGLQQALSGLGLTGNYASWLGQDVTPDVLNQAQNNEYSFAATEGRQHDNNLTALQDVLAAKGILRSGQTGYDTGQENLRHQGALNDAVQNLLGYLSGQYGDFASGEAQRTNDLGDFATTLESNLLNEGAAPAASPGDAVYDSGANAFYLDGHWYNDSGQEIPAPAQPALPPPATPQAPAAQQAVPRNSPAFRRAARRFRRRV